jgi:hypothetical protein
MVYVYDVLLLYAAVTLSGRRAAPAGNAGPGWILGEAKRTSPLRDQGDAVI